MLKAPELKNWLHRDLTRKDKVLLVLASDDTNWQVAEIRARALDAGLRDIVNWNVSQILGTTKGLAIATPKGWELTDAGKQHLRTLGVSSISPAAVLIATDLRNLLSRVKDSDTRAFVQEAVQCYEFELYRSAVVMSWLAAVHVLKAVVQAQYLTAFNTEASRIDQKWKPAKTTDDLGRMQETEFLDRIAAISVIGKNVKDELQKCLKLRNGCGHPNSLKISTNTVASHIEILILNVFTPFAR
ncbi:hypothetical protein LPW26_15090 [Rhodopseudomonas sp. HC1]|uniref:hypothetical protein n=1 Tax=Rhodopseudomonas infernalis TaxID=2897386 RepID=UPI001EE85719|nr:hypothetical protein [Rhodopseudomonas infernalis]MCG6205976.1 hypothetical protein [Rhodopseudomonas infernalis]